MTDIEPVNGGYGPVLDKDVIATLKDLYMDRRYAARDLYDRYSKLVREDGRTPGHPVAFGQGLRRQDCARSTMTVRENGRRRQIVAWSVL